MLTKAFQRQRCAVCLTSVVDDNKVWTCYAWECDPWRRDHWKTIINEKRLQITVPEHCRCSLTVHNRRRNGALAGIQKQYSTSAASFHLDLQFNFTCGGHRSHYLRHWEATETECKKIVLMLVTSQDAPLLFCFIFKCLVFFQTNFYSKCLFLVLFRWGLLDISLSVRLDAVLFIKLHRWCFVFVFYPDRLVQSFLFNYILGDLISSFKYLSI